MQPTNKANHNALRWVRQPVVVLFALLMMAGAVIGIANALYISAATSSAIVVDTSVVPAVDAPDHLPLMLEADPASYERYRILDEQCREQFGSSTYAPLPDCR